MDSDGDLNIQMRNKVLLQWEYGLEEHTATMLPISSYYNTVLHKNLSSDEGQYKLCYLTILSNDFIPSDRLPPPYDTARSFYATNIEGVSSTNEVKIFSKDMTSRIILNLLIKTNELIPGTYNDTFIAHETSSDFQPLLEYLWKRTINCTYIGLDENQFKGIYSQFLEALLNNQQDERRDPLTSASSEDCEIMFPISTNLERDIFVSLCKYDLNRLKIVRPTASATELMSIYLGIIAPIAEEIEGLPLGQEILQINPEFLYYLLMIYYAHLLDKDWNIDIVTRPERLQRQKRGNSYYPT